ncbi:MAG: protein kinase, partial [Planctomycetales bacterium]|nr:protein kinase [Planctomycetales bacterium]
MSPSVADRNLLFGILAVQMEFTTQGQLVSGMNAWVLDKSKPLGEHLLNSGALTADTYQLLSALVDKHIEQHGGQIEKSLAAVTAVPGVRADLACIADVDVQTSLAHVAETAPHARDRHATIAAQPRTASETTRFQILRPHASGGLGRVSVARDVELNREVALKELLDSHADDANSRARFLQEAEITGGLEHPGVVPIYGLGRYNDGRPFYAMRFIRGDSLREAIDRFHRRADPKWQEAATQISLRRLLSRLIDVCNAIEYAHSRGVLHRDLKPGNIMLGQYGETLVVDWGLAKAMGKTGASLAEPTATAADSTVMHVPEPLLNPTGSAGSAPTQMGAAIGTPAFMSPEQAAGRLDQLGPASDIFSLGATLYVLLTGQTPQQDSDLGIVLQRVQRGEFPPPRSIKPVVPRPLEAICLKAMALEPADRYASAQAMADDLEAWLADEPIAALPEPWQARARRWIKKHRAVVSTVAGVALATLAASLLGVAVLTAANQRERKAKDAAVAAESKSRAAEAVALAAKAEADRQIERNAELLDLARRSLENYEKLSKSEELQGYGFEKLRGGLQEAALAFYETLARQTGESEQARAERGDALYRVGNTYWQLGRLSDSLDSWQQARAVFAGLERDFPDNLTYREAAAVNDAAIGEYLTNTQRFEEAAEPLAESRRRLQSLLESQPRNPEFAALLAYGWGLEGERLRQSGDFAGAEACFDRGVNLLRSALELPLDNEKRRDLKLRLARSLNQRAAIRAEALWHFDPARADYAEAREIFGEEYRLRPELSDVGWMLVQTMRKQAELLARGNEIDEAKKVYAKAIDQLAAIEQQYPNVPHYRQEMAELLFGLAGLQSPDSTAKTQVSALERIEPAVRIMENLTQQAPDRTDWKLALARYRGALGAVYMQRGRFDEGKRQFDQALDALGELSENAIRNVDNLNNLASLTYAIGLQLASAGQQDDALDVFNQARQQYEQVRTVAPAFSAAAQAIANVHLRRAEILIDQLRFADALAEVDAVGRISDELKDASDAAWMQTGFRMLTAGAALMRQVINNSLRSGELNPLADRGRYDTLLDQSVRWANASGQGGDHFAAAESLAYAAAVAAADANLEEGPRAA